MAIGITEEHGELQRAARRWVEANCPASVPRAFLDGGPEALPPFWDELAALGWLGLHVAAEYGGEGYGLPEVAVVLEELGRAVAPGPFLPTVLASALIQETGTPEQRQALVPGLVNGTVRAAVGLGDARLSGTPEAGRLRLNGAVGPVLGGGLADVLLLPARVGQSDVWCVVDATAASVAAHPSLDPTRRVGEVDVDGVLVGPERQLPALATQRVRELAAVLLAAECAGGASWCLETASSHAKVREQFGRPIGQFQAVKHKCANMLVAVEQARAVAWDAARAAGEGAEVSLAAAVAAALAPEAFVRCAKDCVQILGGIGFTWEHDAHLYLRRAMAVRQLLGGTGGWLRRTSGLAASGARRRLAVDLPAEAEAYRGDVRRFLDDLAAVPGAERRARLADARYLAPHWPKPWGRDASPVEQLVIDEEFRRAKVRRPHLAVGAWALPTLIAHGTAEQQERFIGPTLRGEITWCQLFSEPGAGSDLASLGTKAAPAGGGWLLTGQKVWTTMAHLADWGICLARTDPDAPKHAGITYFLVDMKSEGIEIRPLRELTGDAMFNEVFLSDVFVPDDCVVGGVSDGWRLARTTLANERVSMGTMSAFGQSEALLAVAGERGLATDGAVQERVGKLLADAQSLAVMGFRMTLRSLSGAEPGPESSVQKLLGVEHDQRVQEAGLELLGPEGATYDEDALTWGRGFLYTRCLTIAGGTSEVQRNVIAERLLGLPRDP